MHQHFQLQITKRENETQINEQHYIIPNNDRLKNYLITKTGLIWDLKNKVYLKPTSIKQRHYIKSTYGYTYAVDHLVASTFIPQPHNTNTVDHIDKNTYNNHVDNLKWIFKDPKEILSEKVNQVDPKSKNIIRTFRNTSEAADVLDVSDEAIRNALCRKSKIVGGFLWEYVDPNNYPQVRNSDKQTITGELTNYAKNSCGRRYMTLTNFDNEKKNCYVSHLVAETFIPDKPHPKAYVNHINSDLNDNRSDNLKWAKPKFVHVKARSEFNNGQYENVFDGFEENSIDDDDLDDDGNPVNDQSVKHEE